MSEWKVENIANLANGKKAIDILSDGEYPIYGGNGVMGRSTKSNASNVAIIGRVGAYCGSVHYSEKECWVSDNAIIAKGKDKNSIKYIYYLLSSLNLNRHHIGGAQPLMTQGIINNIEIPKHTLYEQKKIAAILSSLDDKIETNRRINQRLETLAQALFKSWFIDFEPFGGSMPQDWEVCTLGDIADVTSGKRPSLKDSFESNKTPFPIIGAASVMGYTSEYMCSTPILVIGRVGTHGIVQRLNTKCWPSDNTLIIKTSFYEYAFQILKRIDYSSINRGSTQPLITQTDIRNTQITMPPAQILQKYENIVSSIYQRVDTYEKESARLATLRDALLPKLMSGELKPD